MNCSQALLSLFLLAPCDDQAGGMEAIHQALVSPARPAADVARDADRKPAEVLSFFGIGTGMTVLDLFAGGGYYTQILDTLVGPDGKVLSHNNQTYLDFVGAEFDGRFDSGKLPHSQRLIAEAADIELPGQSLDAVLMALTWHDFYYGDEQYHWPDVDETALLGKLCKAMKPGAILGVVDHVAAPGGDVHEVALSLHRIDPELVKSTIGASCFDLAGESDALRNPADDHTISALKAPIRGHTDRFVLKFVRRDG